MPETTTQAAFARLRGVSRKTVTEWKSKGLLSMTADGLVKVEESEWLLAERPANYRGGATKGSPAGAPASIVRPAVMPDESPAEAAERIVVREGGAPYDHAEAVRIKENYLALLRQLEFDLKSGAVVEVAEVSKVIASEYAIVRNRLLAIPSELAPQVARASSTEEVRSLITAAISEALENLTSDHSGAYSIH